jgi:alkylation response protein AidB-like acyl-CoA dehydrogenase
LGQYHSPYFNETHAALRAEIREWVTNEIEPFVGEWDEARKVPDEIYKQMGTRGYLAGLMGMHYPAEYTNNRIKSVAPEKWDLFHELLLTDELSRAASGGFVWHRLSASCEVRQEGIGEEDPARDLEWR